MLPVMARNVLESIRLIANVSAVFADRCVSGIEANIERCREYAESSPSIVTPLNHYVGYDEAAKIAKQALAERKTIREVVIERGHVPGAICGGEAGRGTRRPLDDQAGEQLTDVPAHHAASSTKPSLTTNATPRLAGPGRPRRVAAGSRGLLRYRTDWPIRTLCRRQ